MKDIIYFVLAAVGAAVLSVGISFLGDINFVLVGAAVLMMIGLETWAVLFAVVSGFLLDVLLHAHIGVSGFSILVGLVVVLLSNAMRLNTRLYEKGITIIVATTVANLAEHLLRVLTGDGVSEVPLLEYLLPTVVLHTCVVAVFLAIARERNNSQGRVAGVRL